MGTTSPITDPANYPINDPINDFIAFIGSRWLQALPAPLLTPLITPLTTLIGPWWAGTTSPIVTLSMASLMTLLTTADPYGVTVAADGVITPLTTLLMTL